MQVREPALCNGVIVPKEKQVLRANSLFQSGKKLVHDVGNPRTVIIPRQRKGKRVLRWETFTRALYTLIKLPYCLVTTILAWASSGITCTRLEKVRAGMSFN